MARRERRQPSAESDLVTEDLVDAVEDITASIWQFNLHDLPSRAGLSSELFSGRFSGGSGCNGKLIGYNGLSGNGPVAQMDRATVS
jgi:hypothetical protein